MISPCSLIIFQDHSRLPDIYGLSGKEKSLGPALWGNRSGHLYWISMKRWHDVAARLRPFLMWKKQWVDIPNGDIYDNVHVLVGHDGETGLDMNPALPSENYEHVITGSH